MKSIAFYNNKGGVGKTTSVINIAYQLAADSKVLVVDLDGQANCSRFFVDEPKVGLEVALTKQMVSPTIALSPTRYPNIDVITATSALNDIVSTFYALPPTMQRENAKKIIKGTENLWYNKYDYVLVDLPPALNKITENIISVCDYVFVPIELGTFAIQGIPIAERCRNRPTVFGFSRCQLSRCRIVMLIPIFLLHTSKFRKATASQNLSNSNAYVEDPTILYIYVGAAIISEIAYCTYLSRKPGVLKEE